MEKTRKELEQQIEDLRLRLKNLEHSTELVEQLEESQQALQSANEELKATEDELRAQADELIAARIELDRAKERYRELFNEAPLAYVVTDDRGLILEVNREAAHLLGHTVQSLTASPRHFLPSFIPAIAKRITFHQSSTVNLEEIPISPILGQVSSLEGKVFWASVTVSASCDPSGKRTSLRWLIRDITDRKRAEQELKKLNDSLEKRVAARTLEVEQRALQLRQLATELTLSEQRERQRLAMILHDGLQQMLVGAKFHLALLERGGDVRAKAFEISELIDDCIETSRSLAVELSPPILFTGGLIPALQWLSKWMHEKHGLTVKLISRDPIDVLPHEVKILLFETSRELLFNIAKHAGVKTAEIEVRSKEGRIQIEVADRGVGFDTRQLKATDGNSGGLGLFSIKERLSYLGGTMEMESSPGKGSRFRLIAPSKLESERFLDLHSRSDVCVALVPKSEPDQIDSDKKIRVVLVDDHVVMRQGLAGLLRSEPDIQIVGEASDGEAGLAVVRDTQPDIVLMDVNMPGMDGIQATKLIHEDMPEIRIIGLSMHQEIAQIVAIREAGAVAYLTKSGPSAAVIDAIRRHAAVSGDSLH